MDLESGISTAAALLGISNLVTFWFAYNRYRHYRGLLEFIGKKTDDLEEAAAKNKKLIEESSQHLSELSRRVVWLETRVRQPKAAQEEVFEEAIQGEPNKPSITERRHRVLTLAARGQTAETIAGTLGMLPGEVELIINLNQAAKNKK